MTCIQNNISDLSLFLFPNLGSGIQVKGLLTREVYKYLIFPLWNNYI